jgi:hypothetical protein
VGRNINSTPLETGDKTVIQTTVMAHLAISMFLSLWVSLNVDFIRTIILYQKTIFEESKKHCGV